MTNDGQIMSNHKFQGSKNPQQQCGHQLTRQRSPFNGASAEMLSGGEGGPGGDQVVFQHVPSTFHWWNDREIGRASRPSGFLPGRLSYIRRQKRNDVSTLVVNLSSVSQWHPIPLGLLVDGGQRFSKPNLEAENWVFIDEFPYKSSDFITSDVPCDDMAAFLVTACLLATLRIKLFWPQFCLNKADRGFLDNWLDSVWLGVVHFRDGTSSSVGQ